MNAMINHFPRRRSINLIRERSLNPARNQWGCSPPLETHFNCDHLSRRGLISINSKSVSLVVATFVAAWVQIASAQPQAKIPRIGYISGTGSATNQGPYVEALRQGMREFSYIEGKNFTIEYRGAEGNLDRIPGLVGELVNLKVDVLVVPIISAARAAKQATKTIPIIVIVSDPVATGIVDSLARPGGNITGLATLAAELSEKRLGLLAEMVPRLSRVGILWDVDQPSDTFDEYKTAARALKIKLQSLDVRGLKPDVEGAFRTAAKGRAQAIITVTSGPLFLQQKKIAELAIKNRLPSLFQGSTWVEAGGLMSYSANDLDAYRRAARYVDKILKGTKPADIPVEQPMKFEFVINLKTAKQIGLNIPQSVLFRADKVIQ
jgi:putative ABC transport system substrate-binding protein